ncbi:MAG: hypothetical protein ACRYG4_15365 [Janthinobacterium lividum]
MKQWRRFGPIVFALAAVLVLCRKVIGWGLRGGWQALPGDPIYNYTILRANYFNAGFVRRGLQGTVLALFDRHGDVDSLVGFHVVCAVFLAVPLALLVRRLIVLGTWQWLWFAAVALLAPQIMPSWSVDVGKGDMMTMGFVAWALLAAVDRRYVLAVVPLAIGYLAHETVIFFGAPLVAAMWFVDYRRGLATTREGLVAVGVLGAALVTITLAYVAFSAPPQEIARVILEGTPRSMLRYYAAYMTMAGTKSATTSFCISLKRPDVALDLAACVVVVLLYAVVTLARTRLALGVFAFAALLPMVLLSAVAVDYGRWVSLAAMVAWLAAAGLRIKGAAPVEAATRVYAGSAAVLALLMAMGSSSIYYANTATQRLSRHLWTPVPMTLEQRISSCDPGWADTIAYPRGAAPR